MPATLPIRVDQSVRDVLASFPGTVPVFERHGLLGCGGTAGPDERVDVFAAVHRIAPEGLVAELNEAAARPAEAIAAAGADPTATLYRRFVVGALASTLTLGAAYGAWNLLAAHLALTSVPDSAAAIHAGFQIFGFVLLFVFGVGFHALPRFFGARLQPLGAARAVMVFGSLGILVRAAGQWKGCAPLLAIAGALFAAAIVTFGYVLHRTRAAAKIAREPFHAWLEAGTGWWLLAALSLFAGGVHALVTGDVSRAFAWNEAAYSAALYGGALAWIAGMLQRVGPTFLGLRPPSPGRSRHLLAVHSAAALAAWLGALLAGPFGLERAELVRVGGLAAVGLFGVCLTFATRALRPAVGHAGVDAPYARGVRTAFAFLLLFAALAFLHLGLTLGPGSNALVHDAARHAFTIGFVALMVLSMASRVLPIFSGRALVAPRLRDTGTALVAAGALLRVAEVPASLAFPSWLAVSAVSGLFAFAGIALYAVTLSGALFGAEEQAVKPTEVPLDANQKVAALVDAYPPALGILVANGFGTLANPIARRTLARAVTLEQACNMHGRDARKILDEIRAAVALPPPTQPAIVAGAARISLEDVREALRDVYDPEIPVNVVDLGLVYDLQADDGEVQVTMTLTAPGCPVSDMIEQDVQRTVTKVAGVHSVSVNFVFEPPWSPEKMTPEARAQLGI